MMAEGSQDDDDGVVEAEIVGLGVDQVVLGTVVSDDRSPSFESIRFRLDPSADVAPGQFVVAHAGNGSPSLVLCRVLNVHEVNPHEDAMSSTIRSVLPRFG